MSREWVPLDVALRCANELDRREVINASERHLAVYDGRDGEPTAEAALDLVWQFARQRAHFLGAGPRADIWPALAVLRRALESEAR